MAHCKKKRKKKVSLSGHPRSADGGKGEEIVLGKKKKKESQEAGGALVHAQQHFGTIYDT